MDYNVKIPVFEGPFDLLFHLVEKEKFDLNDVPLAKITNDYLEMIKMMQELDIHLAGEFLVMAASLLRLKSQALLPKGNEYDRFLNPMGSGMELDIPDPDMEESTPFYFETQEEMVSKLKEYKIYKDMAHKLRECETQNSKIYYKTTEIEYKSSLSVDDLNVNNLMTAFQNAIKNIKDKRVHKIVVEKVSVEDKIAQILKRMTGGTKTTFDELLDMAETKHEIVMTFLAILELIKSQKILVAQEGNFAQIKVTPVPQLEYAVA
ncbi:MAG: segregation/condensation protein A [Candidatus Wallbacteria bacterium]